MQTYFTELPSPSLKHKAHKYTMKKFINGAWKYFYDGALTGNIYKYQAHRAESNMNRNAKQATKEYDIYNKRIKEMKEHNAIQDAKDQAAIDKAKESAAKIRSKYFKRGFVNELRYLAAKQSGQNTGPILNYRRYNNSFEQIDNKRANDKISKAEKDALRNTIGRAQSEKAITRAYDASLAANRSRVKKYSDQYVDAVKAYKRRSLAGMTYAAAKKVMKTKRSLGETAKKTKKFVSNTTKNIADTFREAASKAKKKKKSK